LQYAISARNLIGSNDLACARDQASHLNTEKIIIEKLGNSGAMLQKVMADLILLSA
jgi:hypothetical protein